MLAEYGITYQFKGFKEQEPHSCAESKRNVIHSRSNNIYNSETASKLFYFNMTAILWPDETTIKYANIGYENSLLLW